MLNVVGSQRFELMGLEGIHMRCSKLARLKRSGINRAKTSQNQAEPSRDKPNQAETSQAAPKQKKGASKNVGPARNISRCQAVSLKIYSLLWKKGNVCS